MKDIAVADRFSNFAGAQVNIEEQPLRCKRPKFVPPPLARRRDILGDCQGLGTAGSGEAGRGQLGGLFGGGIVRQPLDDLGQLHLRVQTLDLAVGHERVKQRVVGSCLKTAEEHPVAGTEFSRTHSVLC